MKINTKDAHIKLLDALYGLGADGVVSGEHISYIIKKTKRVITQV